MLAVQQVANLQYAQRHFKVVANNTGALTMPDALASSRVVFLCNKYDAEKYLRANSELLNRFWSNQPQGSHRLFIENDPLSQIPFARREIALVAELWESNQISDEDSDVLDRFEIDLLASAQELSVVLLSACVYCKQTQIHAMSSTTSEGRDVLVAQVNEKRESLLEIMHSIRRFPFLNGLVFPSLQGEFDFNGVDTFVKNLSNAWRVHYARYLEAADGVASRYAENTANSLIESVLKAHREGAARIFLIAGSDHLKIGEETVPSSRAAITRTYQRLQEEGISYVTLKATKANLTEAERQPLGQNALGRMFVARQRADFADLVNGIGEEIAQYLSFAQDDESSLMKVLNSINSLVMAPVAQRGLILFEDRNRIGF